MHRAKQIAGALLSTGLFAVFLLLPAWTVRWERAWVILGINFIGAVIVGSMIPEDLLNERMKGPLRRGQAAADKLLVIAFMASFAATLTLIPLDVFRFHLLPRPPIAISCMGLLLYCLGWTVAASATVVNTFASAAVWVQKERQHHVVDTGPYRIVRHPMYSGLLPVMAGIALWLGSYAAAIIATVPTALIAARAVLEERFLVRELPGYREFMERTRFRLIPFVW